MKLKNLFLLTGPAGCGKSTWAKEDSKHKENAIIISRDAIRFALLGENDDYFAKEDEVVKTFYKEINKAIEDSNYENIYVDATHLTHKARNKTLAAISHNLDKINIIPIAFITTVEKCICNNANRSGRTNVPNTVIKKMCAAYEIPTHSEKYTYDRILIHPNTERS